MDTQALQQIQDILGKNDAIGIAVSRESSLDDMAGALALYLSLKDAGKKVSIASPTEPLVAVSSLVGVDKVKTSLGGDGGDLVVSFPYREGEIEKISYTLENNKLNIIVKAGELGLAFNNSDVEFKQSGGAQKLLFVVGAPTLQSLGSLFNAEALKDTTIVNIDNKAQNQGFGDILYLSQGLSSVSEQVAELLFALNLPVQVDTAQNLLSGISFATENFQSAKTSPTAFEMAGKLMQKGALRKAETVPQMPPDPFFTPRPDLRSQRPFQPLRPQFSQMPRLQNMSQQMQDNKRRPIQNIQNIPQQQFGGGQIQSSQQPQPMQQTSASNSASEQNDQRQKKNPPSDWLSPKIYKGSTRV